MRCAVLYLSLAKIPLSTSHNLYSLICYVCVVPCEDVGDEWVDAELQVSGDGPVAQQTPTVGLRTTTQVLEKRGLAERMATAWETRGRSEWKGGEGRRGIGGGEEGKGTYRVSRGPRGQCL